MLTEQHIYFLTSFYSLNLQKLVHNPRRISFLIRIYVFYFDSDAAKKEIRTDPDAQPWPAACKAERFPNNFLNIPPYWYFY